jgi:cytoskeletal protein RodZ
MHACSTTNTTHNTAAAMALDVTSLLVGLVCGAVVALVMAALTQRLLRKNKHAAAETTSPDDNSNNNNNNSDVESQVSSPADRVKLQPLANGKINLQPLANAAKAHSRANLLAQVQNLTRVSGDFSPASHQRALNAVTPLSQSRRLTPSSRSRRDSPLSKSRRISPHSASRRISPLSQSRRLSATVSHSGKVRSKRQWYEEQKELLREGSKESTGRAAKHDDWLLTSPWAQVRSITFTSAFFFWFFYVLFRSACRFNRRSLPVNHYLHLPSLSIYSLFSFLPFPSLSFPFLSLPGRHAVINVGVDGQRDEASSPLLCKHGHVQHERCGRHARRLSTQLW